MISSEDADNKWLTSVELFETTGISRATLNNYIKMGIIPKPVVRRPENPDSRAKKIGYFPPNVVDSILTVQQMKKEGKSMDSIVNMLTGKNTSGQSVESGNNEQQIDEKSLSSTQDVAHTALSDNFNDFDKTDESRNGSGAKIQEGLLLNLSISNINCPAFLINNNFEIEWINNEAEKDIFNSNIRFIKEASERNIFKLLSKRGLFINNKDKDDLVSYLMRFVKNKITKNSLFNLYSGISEKETQYLQEVYDHVIPISNDSKYVTHVKSVGFNGKNLTHYNAYNIVFREGVLILFTYIDDIYISVFDLIASRQKIIHELMKQRMPSLINFSVLVADLQDSGRICAELPPEDYFELIRDIWKCMDEIFKKYYGTYGKHVGDGMVYYFLKEKNNNYILNSIYCALELREKMKEINLVWKKRKGWMNDLYLNIGINEGQEYFGNTPSPNMEFTALGDTVNYAGRLSDMARFGAIWTTKNLMNKLDLDQRITVNFGIRHMDVENSREIFGHNLFTRVMDMLPINDNNYIKFKDISTLSITEIVSASSYCCRKETEE